MSDRFSVRPLLRSALGGVRVRATVGAERRDWAALLILLGVPVAVGVGSWVLGRSLRDAGSLVGGLSLLGAVLLAVVIQFAAWRQRLSDRHRAADAIARRAIDESVANTLVATLACVFLAALAAVLGNITMGPAGEPVALPGVARAMTAVLVAGSTYLGVTLLLVVNLLFDAYQNANAEGGRGAAGSGTSGTSGGADAA